jgi:co-chaperonin GroES (HSP10)
MAKKRALKPNRDWVMVPDPRKSETDSGIILNESSSNSLKTNILEALDVGPTCEFVKKGDIVMVNPQTEGIIIDVDGATSVLIPEFHVLGVVE